MELAPKVKNVRNAQGVKMKGCCASCANKNVEWGGRRVCRLMQVEVARMYNCKQWEMSEGMSKAGLCMGGRIKRREYLAYVYEIRMLEQKAIEDGIMIPEDAAELDTLRQRFEEETGMSPFANF